MKERLIGESKSADDLLDFFLKEFERKFPGNTIGSIEVWNRFGFMKYKRKQTRREWQKELAAKAPAAAKEKME